MVDTWESKGISGSFEIPDRTVKFCKFFPRDTGTIIGNGNVDGVIFNRNI